MGNAAVMGILPRFRYILLSDLLLESMTDRQIEAAFAHEAGHVAHRHLAWYVILIMTLILFTAFGPGAMLEAQLATWQFSGLQTELVMTGIVAFVFLSALRFVSRRFERQADVFSARVLRHEPLTSESAADEPPGSSGARLLASALHRVAVINNIPLKSGDFLHGSIAARIRFLQHLGRSPELIHRFDASMRWLYLALATAWLMGVAWSTATLLGVV
jgi:STE24 endopeptidase